MDNINYKRLSMVLGLIAIVFAVLYFTKPEDTVADQYADASAQVKECRDNLLAWNQKYSTAPASAEKQSALESVLDDCKGNVAGAQEEVR